jgi:hypothetical protein
MLRVQAQELFLTNPEEGRVEPLGAFLKERCTFSLELQKEPPLSAHTSYLTPREEHTVPPCSGSGW